MPGLSARTQFIETNRAWIEALPIDGIAVNIPASYSLMSPGVRLTKSDLRDWLPQLAAFNSGKLENHLLAFIDRPGDLFDDAAWARVVDNWALLAREAKSANFKGIIFDNEEYFGRWLDLPDSQRGELATFREQAALRGREIMTAVASAFPEAEIAVMHGPYLSVPDTPAAPRAILAQAGGWTEQELRGPFFTGMLEGLGPRQTLIDMGELYQLRTDAEFAQSQTYRGDILPGLIDWSLGSDLRRGWNEAVVQSHMIYTGEFPVGFRQTPGSLVTTLLAAFDNSEEVVYLYSEDGTVDWLTPGDASERWMAALEQAVELADNTERGSGFSDRLTGTKASDRLIGLEGDDLLIGGGGGDFLLGGGGEDILRGDGGADVLAGGKGSDLLFGGDGDDRLEGGEDRDRLLGGDGRDLLIGGTGADTLVGGLGIDVLDGSNDKERDVFRFLTTEDSALGTASGKTDTIQNFKRGGGADDDRIDISRIDAEAGTPLNDTFAFRGIDGVFSSSRGEVRIVEKAGSSIVYLDTDRDVDAEMTIFVAGVTGLSEADFIL